MPYINPDDANTNYRTLDDLVLDLISNPDTLFVRDTGCEALVYVEEFDQLLLIECEEQKDCSMEVCRHALVDKLSHIKKALR